MVLPRPSWLQPQVWRFFLKTNKKQKIACTTVSPAQISDLCPRTGFSKYSSKLHSHPFHCIWTNWPTFVCTRIVAAFVHLAVTFAGDKMDSQKGRDSCLNKLQIHLAPHCCFKGAVWMGIVKFVLSWVGKCAYFCFHLLFVFFSLEKEKICPSPYFVFCGWHIQPYNEDAGMTVFHCKIVEPTCCWHFPGVAVGTLVIQISTFETSNGFFFPPPFRFLASQKSKSQLFEANDTGWVPTNIERLVTSFASLFPPRS